MIKGDDFMNDHNIKHLEFIQSNVNRMNQNSFQLKGWSITILAALLAIFAASIDNKTGSGNVGFIIAAIGPTFLFWLLDSYYLQQERKFRGIYNDVALLTERSKAIDIREFEMPIDKYSGGEYCFIKVMWSRTEWPLYLSLIVGCIIGGLLLK